MRTLSSWEGSDCIGIIVSLDHIPRSKVSIMSKHFELLKKVLDTMKSDMINVLTTTSTAFLIARTRSHVHAHQILYNMWLNVVEVAEELFIHSKYRISNTPTWDRNSSTLSLSRILNQCKKLSNQLRHFSAALSQTMRQWIETERENLMSTSGRASSIEDWILSRDSSLQTKTNFFHFHSHSTLFSSSSLRCYCYN